MDEKANKWKISGGSTNRLHYPGDGPGVVVRTLASHAEDLGSNPIPDIVTYDIKSYSDDFLRKGSKAVGPEMN